MDGSRFKKSGDTINLGKKKKKKVGLKIKTLENLNENRL